MSELSLSLKFPSPYFFHLCNFNTRHLVLVASWSRRRSRSPLSRRFLHTTWDSTCGERLVYVKRRTGLWTNEPPLYNFRHIRHGNPYFLANRKGPGAEFKLRSRAELSYWLACRSRSKPGWNLLTTVSASLRHGSIEEYGTTSSQCFIPFSTLLLLDPQDCRIDYFSLTPNR